MEEIQKTLNEIKIRIEKIEDFGGATLRNLNSIDDLVRLTLRNTQQQISHLQRLRTYVTEMLSVIGENIKILVQSILDISENESSTPPPEFKTILRV